MKQKIYRAKRIDKNEWVYGYYCSYGHTGQEKHYIIPEYASALYTIEIDFKTLGESTNLVDVNGKEIFEGDIHCNENNNRNFVIKMGHFFDKEFGEDLYGWYMEDNKGNRFGLDGSENEYANIIGNTYDNSKLIGE